MEEVNSAMDKATQRMKTLGIIQPIVNPKCPATSRKSTLSPVFMKTYRQSTKIQMSQIHLHIFLSQKRQTRWYIKSGHRDKSQDWEHYLVKQQALTEKTRLSSLLQPRLARSASSRSQTTWGSPSCASDIDTVGGRVSGLGNVEQPIVLLFIFLGGKRKVKGPLLIIFVQFLQGSKQYI